MTTDPNKSRGIERLWRAEIKRKTNKLYKSIDFSALDGLTVNVDDDEQRIISAIMLAMISNSELIFPDDWQYKYQTELYNQTVERAESECKSTQDFLEIDRASVIFLALQGLFNAPPISSTEHRNEIDFLLDRASKKMNGVISVLIESVRQILHDNVGRSSKTQIKKLIRKQFEKAKSQLNQIATTELTQAAQRAVIATAKEISRITGENIRVRWITKNDSRVRYLHIRWHGEIMTQDEALENSQRSPWNCRCGLGIVERNDKKTQDRYDREKKKMLEESTNG